MLPYSILVGGRDGAVHVHEVLAFPSSVKWTVACDTPLSSSVSNSQTDHWLFVADMLNTPVRLLTANRGS